MEKIISKITVLVLGIFIMYACNPNLEDEKVLTPEEEIQTEELIKLGNANLEAQDILLEMLQKEPDLRKELLKIGVEEEGIMLKTLFDPTTESFQRLSSSLLTFKDTFAKYYHGSEGSASAKRSGKKNNEELEKLIQTLVDSNIELYMPYIEEAMLETDNITIVAATLENQGDVVEGYRVKVSQEGGRSNLPLDPPQLIDHVDDDYADGNTTLILMPIDDGGSGGGYGGGGSSGGGSTGGGSSHPHEYEDLYRMLVNVGAIKCNTQYDAFVNVINGGASEFKFIRAYPYYSGGTKSQIAELGTMSLTRRQINRHTVVNVNTSWDNAWAPEELTQGLGIYEYDNTNKTVRLDGTVRLLHNGNVTTTTYDEDFSSKNGVLLNEDLGRENFYYDSEDDRNFGNGFHNGHAWRTAGGLSFTLAPTMEYE
ncbi:hypothetical protein SAMN05661096_04062 [Marivirga sericea]|uniref:Uncharacterized protein n=1 Tax=Marivirga sericea TaxID=1028 RepID=A0A1X7LHF8_9BACT|nr:hypothetical protein [Marivirga sericea]SMG53215.1 hypothetical protein SAMN05661096_04062 [Marivirga sericea]